MGNHGLFTKIYGRLSIRLYGLFINLVILILNGNVLIMSKVIFSSFVVLLIMLRQIRHFIFHLLALNLFRLRLGLKPVFCFALRVMVLILLRFFKVILLEFQLAKAFINHLLNDLSYRKLIFVFSQEQQCKV